MTLILPVLPAPRRASATPSTMLSLTAKNAGEARVRAKDPRGRDLGLCAVVVGVDSRDDSHA